MSVKVRPLQAGDYNEWLVLWRGYLEFYETSITDDVTAETWRRLLDPGHTVSGSARLTARAAWSASCTISSIR